MLHSRSSALLPCLARASKTPSPFEMWLQSRGAKVVANNLKPGMMIAASEIKCGDAKSVLKLTECNHVKPGKGGAFVKSKLLDIQTGIKHQHSFRSDEKVELFEFDSGDTYQFLYESNSILYLMNMDTFEEMEVPARFAGDGLKWLQEGMDVRVFMSGGQPFSVQVPPKATYEIAETEPPRPGIEAGSKPAKLTNGTSIKVPHFVAVGDKVLVNTDEGHYMNRAQPERAPE